jgi:hypothetical protein
MMLDHTAKGVYAIAATPFTSMGVRLSTAVYESFDPICFLRVAAENGDGCRVNAERMKRRN